MTAEELAALQNDATQALRTAAAFGRSGDALAFLDLCLRLGALEPSRSQEAARLAAAEGKALQDALSAQYSAKTDAWHKALNNHDTQKAPRSIHVPPLTPEQEKAVESLPKEMAQIRYVSDREAFGAESIAREDAQKEPQRYRLECTCTSDPGRYVVTHGSNCPYFSKREETPPVIGPRPATETRCAMLSCKNPPVDGTPLCVVHEGDVKNAPVLSPRQALGEALACVERARSLLGAATAHIPDPVRRDRSANAYQWLVNAATSIRNAYEPEA